MKVSDLKASLEHIDDDRDVMILVKLPYATAGARPMVHVDNVHFGFDWEAGRLIITPTEPLTPSDRDFVEKMTKMQEDLGWAHYENRGLKSEIKKLKALLK